MPWWGTVLFLAAVMLAIWGFLSIVGFRTRTLTRKTDRRAEDLYPNYAGSQRETAPLSARPRRTARSRPEPG